MGLWLRVPTCNTCYANVSGYFVQSKICYICEGGANYDEFRPHRKQISQLASFRTCRYIEWYAFFCNVRALCIDLWVLSIRCVKAAIQPPESTPVETGHEDMIVSFAHLIMHSWQNNLANRSFCIFSTMLNLITTGNA
jgi:hypothetical protein